MAFQQNLGRVARAGYVLMGAGLLLWGFFGTGEHWAKVVLPILGALVLVEGLIGF